MYVWVGCVSVCVQRKLSPNGEVGESESQGKDRDRRDGPGIVQSIGQFCWAVISSENKRFFDKWRNIKTEGKNANLKLGMVISPNTNFTDFLRLQSHLLPNTHSHTHPIPALTSHTHTSMNTLLIFPLYQEEFTFSQLLTVESTFTLSQTY